MKKQTPVNQDNKLADLDAELVDLTDEELSSVVGGASVEVKAELQTSFSQQQLLPFTAFTAVK